MASLLTGAQQQRGEPSVNNPEEEDDDINQVLHFLKLSKYSYALIEAGYDDLDCFDLGATSEEELMVELVDEVKMKKPHARKLLRYLQKLAQKRSEDDLPMALNVEHIVQAEDIQALEKEIRVQMENEFAVRIVDIQTENAAAMSELQNQFAQFRQMHAEMSQSNTQQAQRRTQERWLSSSSFRLETDAVFKEHNVSS